jgi:hypothetical protein
MNINEIGTFENWLGEKTGRAENLKKQRIDIGTLSLSLSFPVNQQGDADPLRISVHSPLLSLNHIEFKLVNSEKREPATQFIKRIPFTPFYHSYVTGEAFSSQMVDFFLWDKSPVIYRMFNLQKFQDDGPLRIRFPEMVQSSVSKDTIRIGDLYFEVSLPVDLEKEKNCITFKTDNAVDKQFFVMAISPEPVEQEISFSSTFKSLRKAEELCREYHIGKNFMINYPAAEKELDDSWTAQKYIHPDRTIDPAILNDPEKYEQEITWLVELACFLGWSKPLMDIRKMIKKRMAKNKMKINWRLLFTACYIENYLHMKKNVRLADHLFPKGSTGLKKGRDDTDTIFCQLCGNNVKDMIDNIEDDFIYSAYFNNTFKNGELAVRLQRWWNLYSLPLMQKRLDKESAENQEKVLLILLLAIRYRLPWASILMQYIQQKDFHPLFHLIAFLFSRLIIRNSRENNVHVFSGYQWDTNVKKLCRECDNISHAYTTFSKKTYFALKQNNKALFKIDHQVDVIYDTQKHEYTVYPAVLKIDPTVYHLFSIKVDDHSLKLPLVFKKGELMFHDVRLRWIFKKKRFQFTLLVKDRDKKIVINNQPVHFKKSIKQKYYLPVEAKDPGMELQLLDNHGRSIHFSRVANIRDLQIVGWSCDRFGLLAQYFNYQYARKQYLNNIDPSGAIDKKISIPSEMKSITFLVKRAKQELPLTFYTSLFMERLCKFSAQKWSDSFIVLIDEPLIKEISKIKKYFDHIFAFQPQYCIKKPGMKSIQSSILLYITISASDVSIVEDRSISLQPFCRIGIKKGIGNVSRFFLFLKEQVSGK